MAKLNLQTWARIARLDLQHLAAQIGSKSLEFLKHWPKSGEGRAVKASTEKMIRDLDHTFESSDLHFIFDNFELVIKELESINQNSFFRSYLMDQEFVNRSGAREIFSKHVDDKIKSVRDFIDNYRPVKSINENKPGQVFVKFPPEKPISEKDAENNNLKDLIPGQKIGPLQFEFVHGILKLKQQKSNLSRDGAIITDLARDALIKEGANLVEFLNETNCDQRIVGFMSEVNDCILQNSNIINLGMLNITCGALIKTSFDELPNIVNAKFIGFNSSLSLYVAQFPEWKKFLENSADIEFSDQDYRIAYEVGRSFIEPLKKAKGLVDPEVPRSIELLFEAFRNPSVSMKRQVFSVVRTLENLIAKIFSEFAKFYQAISDGGQAGVKRATSVLVTSGLIVTVATLATQLSPTAARVLHSDWMAKAPDLIKAALEYAE